MRELRANIAWDEQVVARWVLTALLAVSVLSGVLISVVPTGLTVGAVLTVAIALVGLLGLVDGPGMILLGIILCISTGYVSLARLGIPYIATSGDMLVVVVAGSAFYALIRSVHDGLSPIRPGLMDLALGAFLLVGFPGLMVQRSADRDLSNWFHFVLGALAFYVARTLLMRKPLHHARSLCKLIVALSMGAVLVGFIEASNFQLFSLLLEPWLSAEAFRVIALRLLQGRVVSVWLNAGIYGTYLSVAFSCAIALFWSRKCCSDRARLPTYGALGAAVVIGIGALLTGQRITLLLLSVIVVCYLLPWRGLSRDSVSTPLLVVLLTVAMFLGFFATRLAVSDRVQVRFVAIDEADTILSRLSLWRLGLGLFRESPWIGLGLGSFAKYNPESEVLAGGVYPHNIVVKLLVETGVGGLCLFALVVVGVLRAGVARLREFHARGSAHLWVGLGLLFAWGSILLGALTTNVFDDRNLIVLFWLISGAIVALHRTRNWTPGQQGHELGGGLT